jgi:hypothetical protein
VERIAAPYRDKGDQTTSFGSLVCLMILAFTLSLSAPNYSNVVRGILVTFSAVPSVLLLMWVFIRLFHARIEKWKTSGALESQPKWKRVLIQLCGSSAISFFIRNYAHRASLTHPSNTSAGHPSTLKGEADHESSSPREMNHSKRLNHATLSDIPPAPRESVEMTNPFVNKI